MTAAQIIGKIISLPASDRSAVIRFARCLSTEDRLSGDAMRQLAERLAVEEDPAEIQILRDSIESGFYGRP